MNLPNKLTMARIILSIVIVIVLLFPFDALGIEVYQLFINEAMKADIRYIIAGIIFIVASLTDFFDGRIARKRNLVTDLGKMLDSIADKMLVNSVLIILASKGFIHPIIPVVIILRDSIVNSIKMIAGSKGNVVAAIKTGKVKATFLMVGIVLTLFYNLPFELWNLKVSEFILVIACVFAVISAAEYYNQYKKYIFPTKEK